MMKSVEHYLSLNYPISIHKDDEGDFIAEVQELSGCLADGATPNEAFENVREAMRSWIESRLKAGLEVPEPRADQEFSGKVLLRMPRWLHRRLSQQARTENSSLNQYMVSLLAERCGTGQSIYEIPAWKNMVYRASYMPSDQGFVSNESVFGISYNLALPRTSYVTAPIDSAKERKALPERARTQMVA